MDDILRRLSSGDPRFTHLDLREIDAGKEELSEIVDKLGNNTAIISVSWRNEHRYDASLKKWIEDKVESNYQRFQSYPNDFVLGLLSCHVYTAPEENEKVEFSSSPDTAEALNEELKSWSVFKIYGSSESGRYYGVAYLNEGKKQLVLAHRGAELKMWDFAKHESPLKTDLDGILDGKIVKQQWEACVATEKVVKHAKANGYTVSFTGQALGAWLAELSLYFTVDDFYFQRCKAVTFDSPGSALVIESLESDVESCGFDPTENLDITTYLSAPNLVNSCNPHFGKVYRIFPDIIWTRHLKKLRSQLKKIPIAKHFEPVLMGLLSTSGHRVERMVAIFDSATGKPKTFEKVLDWPYFLYEPKTLGITAEVTPNTLTSILSLCKSLPSIGWLAYEAFSKPTIFTVLEAFDKLLNGGIELQEFQTVYESSEVIAKKGGETLPIISEEHFNLRYEGHYSTRELNSFKDYHNYRKSNDWYLDKLDKLSINEIHEMEIGDDLKIELKHLKCAYKIKFEPASNAKYISVNSPDVNIDALRAKFVRLCEKYREIIEVFGNKYAFYPHKKPLTPHGIISSNLPRRPNHFLERPEVMKEIGEVLGRHKFVAISGPSGTGRSTIAAEYGRDLWEKSNGQIVRIIDADCPRKVNTAYEEIAKTDFGLNVQDQLPSNVMQSVHNGIEKSGLSALFIFNNVEKYGDVEAYLGGLSKMKAEKVIITTIHNNLSENLQNINLKPFTREEAKLYLENTTGDRFSPEEIDKLVDNFASERFLLPYKMSLTVQYFKEFGRKPKRCVKDLAKCNGETGTILLSDLVNTSELSWLILQYSAHLDPDFISVDIFKELLGKDNNELLAAFKKLESLGFISLLRQNGESGLKLHRMLQHFVRKFADTNAELISVIDKPDIFEKALEALHNLRKKDTFIMDHQLVHIINGSLRWLGEFNHVASNTRVFAEKASRVVQKISDSGPPIKSYIGASDSIANEVTTRMSQNLSARGWSKGDHSFWFESLHSFIDRAICTEGGFILATSCLVGDAVESNNQMCQRYPNDFLLGLFTCHAHTDAVKNAGVKFPSNSGVTHVEAWTEELRTWRVFEVFEDAESGHCSVAYLNEEKKQMVLAHCDIVLELRDSEGRIPQTKLVKFWDSLSRKSPSWTDLVSVLDGKVRKLLEHASVATGAITKHAKEKGFTVAFTGNSLGAYLAEFSFARGRDACLQCKAVTFDKPKLLHSDIFSILSCLNRNNDPEQAWQCGKPRTYYTLWRRYAMLINFLIISRRAEKDVG